jgi:hypothetical protein
MRFVVHVHILEQSVIEMGILQIKTFPKAMAKMVVLRHQTMWRNLSCSWFSGTGKHLTLDQSYEWLEQPTRQP